jgi:isocitrate dehydrogenase kinase/phosphatase
VSRVLVIVVDNISREMSEIIVPLHENFCNQSCFVPENLYVVFQSFWYFNRNGIFVGHFSIIEQTLFLNVGLL